MPNPTRIEINCTTGVESIIELTDAEVAQMEADQAAAQVRQDEQAAQDASDAVAKEALLVKLDITAEELEILLK